MTFGNVVGAIEDIAKGRMVILVDDEDRENEGDLCMAADLVTADAINFMALHARGLICLTLTAEKIRELGLPMMVERNTSTFETGFTVSIEARHGVSTGISARDRARTIGVAVADDAKPEDLVSPGHVFPIRARDGGVLVRTGQTEGSVDLARLAGRTPAGVICEIMNPDGTMARRAELERFAATHGLRIVTIAELVEYRLARESLVEIVGERRFERTPFGPLTVAVVRSRVDGREHVVFKVGEIESSRPTLVRVQSVDLPGDILGIALTAGSELTDSLQAMADEGAGVFVLLVRSLGGSTLSERLANIGRRETKSPAEENEAKSPAEEKKGSEDREHRTGERLDLREFGIGAQILKAMDVRRFRLLNRHDVRIVGLEGFDLEMVERVDLPLAREEVLGE